METEQTLRKEGENRGNGLQSEEGEAAAGGMAAKWGVQAGRECTG